MSEQNTFRISGQIKFCETGEPVQEILVSVRDLGFLFDDRLGSVFTDEFGHYEISYSQADFPDFFEARPDTYIVVKASDGTVHFPSEEHALLEAGKDVSIDVALPYRATKAPGMTVGSNVAEPRRRHST